MSAAEIASLLKVDQSDYYGILSCTRTSTAEELKRAYRRLALKFHPDKNKLEGADEAFKLVAKAFSVVGDEKKRAEYDRFGVSNSGDGRSSHHSNPFNQFSANGDISPEDLFNLFFGGGIPGGMPGGVHFQFGGFGPSGGFESMFNHAQQQQQQRHQYRRQQPTPVVDPWTELKHKLLQILPILVFLVYSLLGVLFNNSSSTGATPKQSSKMPEFKDWVSLDYAPPHLRFPRHSAKHSVPYFSSLRFEQRFQPGHGQGRELGAFEEMIERGFLKRLQEDCKREEGGLARALGRAGVDEEARSAATRQHPLPSCTKLRQFFNK